MTPIRRAVPVAAVLSAALAGILVFGCSEADPSTSAPATTEAGPECLEEPQRCARDVAAGAGVLVGAAVDSQWLEEPQYAEVLAREFNSLTAEREMKWDELQPERGVFDFTAADELVAFAEANDMAVRGHTLVWDQEYLDSTPQWVLEVTDPEELRTVLREHFSMVLRHFGDSVDRWDVLNEPLATVGSGWYENHFHKVLGPGYAAELFQLADEVAPGASLWLNEAAVEYNPAKADALFTAVETMVDAGVPIDGVGLQGHLLGGAPQQGLMEELVRRLSGLGLEVAITELDVPVEAGADAPRAEQAATYEQVAGECLAAGCSELTMWGVHDAQTWLDDFLAREDTDPLLFGDDLRPKQAYGSTKEAIVESVD